MSEYQYYEFHAIDRPLDDAAQSALRAISTRARITATSFINSYQWGDLKADPGTLLKRYFDVFLYTANWGTRQFAMKLPKQLVDIEAFRRFLSDDEIASIEVLDRHVIVDICRNEEYQDWEDDGSGWLAALAGLRADVMSGDLSLFALLWLIRVEDDEFPDDAEMPAPGLEAMTGPLAALAEFLRVDSDLIEAALHFAPAAAAVPSAAESDTALRRLPEDEKVALLRRVQQGDPYVAIELRRLCRASVSRDAVCRPTAGQLRAAAAGRRAERDRIAAEREAATRRRREAEAVEAQARRIAVLVQRGDAVWHDVEEQIALRNPAGYDQAASLLDDLAEIAAKSGRQDEFAKRLSAIRTHHERKGRFIERLDKAGLP